MDYKEKTIEVNLIKLDLENPRFPPVDSEREAIKSMLEGKSGEQITKLADDIYQNGVNPSVRVILFKDGKNASRFVDGDGNRRLTALKILETPSLADSNPKVRKKINSILKKSGSVPTAVSCVVFKNREAARHWILVNHDGAQEGRGQINWDAEQKNRFEGKSSIGLQALDLLSHRGLLNEEDKKQINKSTLDRLLSYKDVKSKLSISKKGEHFSFGNIGNLKSAVLNLRSKAVDEVYTAAKGKQFVDASIISQQAGTQKGDADDNTNPGGDADTTSSKANRSRRTQKPGLPVFGGKLSLKSGHVNNLYRDIESLYDFYLKDKKALSADFIVLFRMSLRLLAETASKEAKKDLQAFLKENFDQAKKALSQDAKTSLSNQSVSKDTAVKLFHTGAHDYTNSRNEEQALAMSVILGAILNITHGKQS